MKLIVGLGNPGKEYENTRHNIGFMIIDELLKRKGSPKLKDKFGGKYYEYIENGEKVILLKPQEYINLSGKVLFKYLNYFDIDIDDILVINDDLDLEIGKYKLKPFGGTAGHNGLKNIEFYLKTDKYKRLKIGISNNKEMDTKDYVLGKLDSESSNQIKKIIDICVDIVEEYPFKQFDELMNKYNTGT